MLTKIMAFMTLTATVVSPSLAADPFDCSSKVRPTRPALPILREFKDTDTDASAIRREYDPRRQTVFGLPVVFLDYARVEHHREGGAVLEFIYTAMTTSPIAAVHHRARAANPDLSCSLVANPSTYLCTSRTSKRKLGYYATSHRGKTAVLVHCKL